MKFKNITHALFVWVAFTTLCTANEEMIRCPEATKMAINTPYTMEVFILVDETTYFTQPVRENIARNVSALIKQGAVINIIGFSTYTSTHHTSLKLTERISRPLRENELYNLRVKGVGEYEKCINTKQEFLKQKALAVLEGMYRPKEQEVAKSDILWSFQNISQNAIKPSPFSTKVVLIVSDLLENSSVTSFYKKGDLRKIESENELRRVEAEKLFGAFEGSFIFVIGAGAVDVGKSAYRDHHTLQALRNFWETYFERSGGTLIAMGMPILERVIGE
ncbi:MAG: hypothetical protein IBX45_10930 [Campylobacterales bacterium]|nr:hypothetical protein [Campylobacterales bacterium]